MPARPPKLTLPAPVRTGASDESSASREVVGYGRPPISTRFKPGESGNPRGRPKGAKNKLPALNEERLKSIIIAEAYRTVKVNDGPRQVTVSMAQAIMRSLAVNAAKGQHRSQRLFSELLSAAEASNKALNDEWISVALDYKKAWEKEIARCKHLGLPLPDPVPHPDHIELNMRTGEIEVDGPMTTKQRQLGRDLVQRLIECKDEIAWLNRARAKTKDEKLKAVYENTIGHETKLHDTLMAAVERTPWLGREWAAATSVRKAVDGRP